VAESLIALSGERAGEYAGRIGEHFEKAGDWAPAANWYGRAGKQAQAAYAAEAAIAFYQKALKFWQEVKPLSEHQTRQLLEVYNGLGEALVSRARYVEGVEAFLNMRAIAEDIGDAVLQARAWYSLSRAQGLQGDPRAGLESAARAEAVARAAGARPELALALWAKGLGSLRTGDTEAALALGEQILALAAELGDRRQRASTLNLLGGAHNMLGRYEQAQRCWEEALAIWQELDDRRQISDLFNNLGLIAAARGDHSTALERYQAALSMARDIGDRDGELVFLNNLGTARVGLGEFQAAEADMRQVIQMAGAAGSWILGETYRTLAEAALGQDKIEAARAAAQQALTLGQSGGIQEYIGPAWRVLGMVAARLSEPVMIVVEDSDPPRPFDAPACFAESARICAETGMEGERAQTLREWARYELARGDTGRGAALWQEARQLFTQLGAELEVARMREQP
jgi:tetratricopeptide (TPR) repeat protein